MRKENEYPKYTQSETIVIESHIEEHFGNIDFSVTGTDRNGNAVLKIAVIKPNAKRKFWTLVTTGLGAWKMNIPKKFDDMEKRTELLMYVQPKWNCNPDVLNTPDAWPLEILFRISQKPSEKDGILIRGASIDFLDEDKKQDFIRDTKYSGVMLIPCFLSDRGADICVLPNNERVSFSAVFPLYQEECELYKTISLDSMHKIFGKLFKRPVQNVRMNFG